MNSKEIIIYVICKLEIINLVEEVADTDNNILTKMSIHACRLLSRLSSGLYTKLVSNKKCLTNRIYRTYLTKLEDIIGLPFPVFDKFSIHQVLKLETSKFLYKLILYGQLTLDYPVK